MTSLPDAQLAPEEQIPSLEPAPHFSTAHETAWYKISELIGWGGSASQLLGRVNPAPATPRTVSKTENGSPRKLALSPPCRR